jgi:bifunctional DNA-binding transcriptional regulator/antitoxin component of YhaV-PrlF toxin-antitoxin module
MHRQILGLKKGDGLEVDHIDHNGLNCQRDNLRIATHLENSHNQQKKTISNNHFKGTYWNKKDGAWEVRIRPPQSKKIYVGSFKDEVEAARAYDKKARELFGEFAHLNFNTPENQIACAAI